MSDVASWKADEAEAELMIPTLGRLYRDHGVVVMLNGLSLVQRSPVDIVVAHRRGHTLHGRDLPASTTRQAIEALADLDLARVEIDVGRLIADWQDAGAELPLPTWIAQATEGLPTRATAPARAPRDVVLYGFGRIGRLLGRLLVTKTGGGDKYRLRAIVVRKRADDDLHRRANLFRRDSVHGGFPGTVKVLEEQGALEINGQVVHIIQADGPDTIDYTAYGIHDAIIIDNTGAWRDREKLSRHLLSKGAGKVLLTAPGKGDVPNIVHGVNHGTLSPDERVISAASCTTNAIVPVLKVLDDAYGVVKGHIETVHAYTNDQNLIDNYHKKARRGRGAAMNLVITETGAASAVAKALPHLAGRITGSAIRVPVPNVSLAILNLTLKTPVARDAVNAWLREVATASDLRDQIGWTAMVDTVSSDLIGDTHAGVIDAEATQVLDDQLVLYVWYDNEHGYAWQVMRVVEHLTGVSRPRFP